MSATTETIVFMLGKSNLGDRSQHFQREGINLWTHTLLSRSDFSPLIRMRNGYGGIVEEWLIAWLCCQTWKFILLLLLNSYLTFSSYLNWLILSLFSLKWGYGITYFLFIKMGIIVSIVVKIKYKKVFKVHKLFGSFTNIDKVLRP